MRGRACSWEILHACNYRCPYCFFIPSWENNLEETNSRHRDCAPEEWTRFWRRLHELYGSFEIDVVGGEPFLYPRFIPLIRELSRWHTFTIITNLSWSVSDAAGLDPARVRLQPSFHPHFAEIGEFTHKVLRLRALGFTANVIIVSYPPIFEQLPGMLDVLRASGIPCWVAPYQGTYEGQTYPAAFTAEQKAWMYGTHGKEARGGFDVGVKTRSPEGRMCASGNAYFRAYPDGVVYRCISVKDLPGGKPIGHMKDPQFRLADAATPCPATYCYSPLEYRNLLDLEAARE